MLAHVRSIDEIDKRILSIVRQDGRITNAKLAATIHLSAAATHKRLRRLERSGYINGYAAKLNLSKLGLQMCCYVQVRLKEHAVDRMATFCETIQTLPEVTECNFVTGNFDFVLKVALRDQRHLEHFLSKQLMTIPGVDRVETNLIVTEVKR